MTTRDKDLQRGFLWEINQVPKLQNPVSLDGNQSIPSGLLQGQNLVGEVVDLKNEFTKSKVNMVIFSQKRMVTARQVDSWRIPFKQIFHETPIFEIFILKHWFHKLFSFVVNKQLKQVHEEKELKNIIYVKHSEPLIPEKLGFDIENSILAHVLLVDQRGRIHWRAWGTSNTQNLLQLCLAHDKMMGIRDSHLNLQSYQNSLKGVQGE
eukprot:TRINITY_DN5801_c0_g1_i3.p1 TRINITY_DN5801_c0_g1~~TRINITY_DN5801_c0_g1_i3.p1  ORF type:complete len:208 (-),score=35.45 TRINITY_DN5801_c0_g1_i3:112-735(-)